MLEAAQIGDMPRHSMDNPYQPPTAPLVTGTTESPVDRSVTIDTPKGPVKLEQRGERITLVFNSIWKDIPASKFASAVLLHFTRTKRVSFKPIGLYSIVVSLEKFREVLDFYGIERFKYYDVRNMRVLHCLSGLLFLFLTALNTHTFTIWSIYTLGLLCFSALSLMLFFMTFFRVYLTFWLISTLTYLLLGATMVKLWYTSGDWWVVVVLIFTFFSVSTNLDRVRYFRTHTAANCAQ
jgi:hypothetical protein